MKDSGATIIFTNLPKLYLIDSYHLNKAIHCTQANFLMILTSIMTDNYLFRYWSALSLTENFFIPFYRIPTLWKGRISKHQLIKST